MTNPGTFDPEATLAVIAVLETAFREHRPTELADVHLLLEPWANNGRPLLAAAMTMLTAVLPAAFDDPLEYLTLIRGDIVNLMAARP